MRMPERGHARAEWVDGLRGIASLAVCLSHVVGGAYPDLYFAYGDGSRAHSRSWLKLPIIRLPYSGDAAVALFFLISGYALSIRPLRRAYQSQHTTLHAEIASSVLRRTGRLLLPALAVSFATMLAAQAGAFDHVPLPATFFFVSAHRQPSLLTQANLWLRETLLLLFPPNGNDLEVPVLAYGTQLWTIPVELRASFVVYLFLLALTPLRPVPRLTIAAAAATFSLVVTARWDHFLFLVGMAVAELSVRDSVSVQHSRSLPPFTGALRAKWKWTWSPGWVCPLVVGLLLASEPTVNAAAAPGWAGLNRLVPAAYGEENVGRFWVAIGAVCVFLAMEQWRLPQALLATSLLRWLGSISFGLYLVHNAVMSSLGAWLMARRAAGQEAAAEGSSTGGMEGGVVAILCLVVVVSLGAAHVFRRFVDEPTTRFMAWMEGRLLGEARSRRGGS